MFSLQVHAADDEAGHRHAADRSDVSDQLTRLRAQNEQLRKEVQTKSDLIQQYVTKGKIPALVLLFCFCSKKKN